MTVKLEFVHSCNADIAPMNNGKPCGVASVERIDAGVYFCQLHRDMAEHTSVPVFGGGSVRAKQSEREHTSETQDKL